MASIAEANDWWRVGGRGIASLRTFDTVSPRQCPTKKYRLAITTLRTPDARSAQSNNVIVGFRLNAPTLRCRCVATPRLVANKDFVTAPSLRPRRGFAVFAKCFRLDTASPPAAPSVRCRHDATPRRPLQSVCRNNVGYLPLALLFFGLLLAKYLLFVNTKFLVGRTFVSMIFVATPKTCVGVSAQPPTATPQGQKRRSWTGE